MALILKMALDGEMRRKRLNDASELTVASVDAVVNELFGLTSYVATFQDSDGAWAELTDRTLEAALDMSRATGVLRLSISPGRIAPVHPFNLMASSMPSGEALSPVSVRSEASSSLSSWQHVECSEVSALVETTQNDDSVFLEGNSVDCSTLTVSQQVAELVEVAEQHAELVDADASWGPENKVSTTVSSEEKGQERDAHVESTKDESSYAFRTIRNWWNRRAAQADAPVEGSEKEIGVVEANTTTIDSVEDVERAADEKVPDIDAPVEIATREELGEGRTVQDAARQCRRAVYQNVAAETVQELDRPSESTEEEEEEEEDALMEEKPLEHNALVEIGTQGSSTGDQVQSVGAGEGDVAGDSFSERCLRELDVHGSSDGSAREVASEIESEHEPEELDVPESVPIYSIHTPRTCSSPAEHDSCEQQAFLEAEQLGEKIQRNASAIKIQSHFRGKIARSDSKRRREEREARMQEIERNTCAAKLQSNFRGKLARNEVKRLREEREVSSAVEETDVGCTASSDSLDESEQLEQRALTSLEKIRIVIAAFDSNGDGHLDFHDSNELQKFAGSGPIRVHAYTALCREFGEIIDVGLGTNSLAKLYERFGHLERDFDAAIRKLNSNSQPITQPPQCRPHPCPLLPLAMALPLVCPLMAPVVLPLAVVASMRRRCRS